jgi:hypothetical protein
MKVYKIENKKMPWGDYGNILLTGILNTEGGVTKIKRTGPYIPPITICGIDTVVVTTEFKELIESSGLQGFSFTPMDILKLVNIDWTNWDLRADEPKFYPETGEPEDYIDEGQNDDKLLSKVKFLWTMNISNKIEVELKQGSDWWINIPQIRKDSWKENFGVTEKIRYVFVDDIGKDWLTDNCDGQLSFTEIEFL